MDTRTFKLLQRLMYCSDKKINDYDGWGLWHGGEITNSHYVFDTIDHVDLAGKDVLYIYVAKGEDFTKEYGTPDLLLDLIPYPDKRQIALYFV